MKSTIKMKIEVDIKTLLIEAGARYWEDSTVNGVDDEDGSLIPCRVGEYWCPIIDIETGRITNWEQGKIADVHYKVCDDGTYYLLDESGKKLFIHKYYVPKILDLYNDSFGDYIILKIDENGFIADWNNNPNIDDFKTFKE